MTADPARDDRRWGEARVRERRRRRLRRVGVVVGATLLVMLGVPFVAGLADGALHRPHRAGASAGEVLATVVAIAVVIVSAGVWGWRDADEVQRRRAVEVWAAIGFVGFLGHPLFQHLQRALALAPTNDAVWWTSLAAGGAVALYHRFRG